MYNYIFIERNISTSNDLSILIIIKEISLIICFIGNENALSYFQIKHVLVSISNMNIRNTTIYFQVIKSYILALSFLLRNLKSYKN